MSILPQVRQVVRSCCPTSPIYQLRTLDSIVDDSVWKLRYLVLLVGALALLGLVLTGLGVYGTLSDSMRTRTAEIGVRVALGVGYSDVLPLVL